MFVQSYSQGHANHMNVSRMAVPVILAKVIKIDRIMLIQFLLATNGEPVPVPGA